MEGPSILSKAENLSKKIEDIVKKLDTKADDDFLGALNGTKEEEKKDDKKADEKKEDKKAEEKKAEEKKDEKKDDKKNIEIIEE